MRNLNYINTVEIDEYNLIKNSKHHQTRNRLNAIQSLVVTNYDLYLNNFHTIHQIGVSVFDANQTIDLKGCYKIKTVARDRLLSKIVNSQTTHFKHICPYCLLLPRTTYDHYIPEDTYPVYSVLAKNLIPCCSTCNGKKLDYWRESGARAILHYYNDLIPQAQFLFGTLTFNQNSIPLISFAIQQPHGVSNDFFLMLQKHFERLELATRYSDNIDLIISDIIDDVMVNRIEFGNVVTPQAISNIILNKSNRLKQYYGINYWRSVAMDLLGNSTKFINTI